MFAAMYTSLHLIVENLWEEWIILGWVIIVASTTIGPLVPKDSLIRYDIQAVLSHLAAAAVGETSVTAHLC